MLSMCTYDQHAPERFDEQHIASRLNIKGEEGAAFLLAPKQVAHVWLPRGRGIESQYSSVGSRRDSRNEIANSRRNSRRRSAYSPGVSEQAMVGWLSADIAAPINLYLSRGFKLPRCAAAE